MTGAASSTAAVKPTTIRTAATAKRNERPKREEKKAEGGRGRGREREKEKRKRSIFRQSKEK